MASIQELQAALLAHRHAVAQRDTALTVKEGVHGSETRVNWRDVVRVLEDAHVSVSSEGQFRSTKVRDALPLVDLALAALSESADNARDRLERSDISWSDHLLALLPGPFGSRARRVLTSYRKDKLELNELTRLLEQVKEQRQGIAEAIDLALDSHLLQTNEEYRALAQEASAHKVNLRATEEHLHGLDVPPHRSTLEQREMATIFYKAHKCIPELPEKRYNFEYIPEHLKPGLIRFQVMLEQTIAQLEARLMAMRNEHKERIYQESP